MPRQKPPVVTSHPMRNEDVAAAFTEMAQLLSIEGANRFRVRAYERAAQVIRALPRPLEKMGGPAQWDKLPGIGVDLAAKIATYQRNHTFPALDSLRHRVPTGLRSLLAPPGLGPARVGLLHQVLHLTGIGDLRRAVRDGTLARVRGFGPALVGRIEAALATTVELPKRVLWHEANEAAQALCEYLRQLHGVHSVDVAGSIRRGRDTVGDIDIVVCARAAFDLSGALRRNDSFKSVAIAGATRCTAVLASGLQVDVRLVKPISRGAALYYLTGSREHNLHLRQIAAERGLKLNEYGLYRGRVRIAGATEDAILKALDLQWIPPELRENTGEIEAAARGALPGLIDNDDLRGDLHVHTVAGDGTDSIKQIADAARQYGLEYAAITDHGAYLGFVHGLDKSRLERQIDEIDQLNAAQTDCFFLKGCEVDILEDGRLALPTALLRKLDVVVAAAHGHFGLNSIRQTARLKRAIDHPCITVLAHPTGRLLNRRPPCDADFPAILDAARDRGCFLELNAQPDRMDLSDTLARAARDRGVLISVASDAHAARQFSNLAGGVRQSRRAWLRPEDVVNTRPLAKLRKLLASIRH